MNIKRIGRRYSLDNCYWVDMTSAFDKECIERRELGKCSSCIYERARNYGKLEWDWELLEGTVIQGVVLLLIEVARV